MIKKKTFFIFMFCFVLNYMFAQEQNSLEIFTFGPKTDNALVLCFTEKNKNDTGVLYKKLKNFIQNFDDTPNSESRLQQTLIIAISYNDYSDLPNDVEVQTFVGMNELVNEIVKYKNPSVFIFNEAQQFQIQYSNEYKRSPLWLLKLFLESTDLQYRQKIFFTEPQTTQAKDSLNIFFIENIPALLIKLLPETNIEALILNLSKNYPKYFSKIWEQNFFLLYNFGSIKIIPEKLIIIFIEIFLCLIFFALFLKALIQKKRIKLKKILLYSFFYLLLLGFNICCIASAQFLTRFVFQLFLGTSKIIPPFECYYIIIFASLFLITILFFQSLIIFFLQKKEFHFKIFKNFYPTVCLVNFFVLVILDFSVFLFAFLSFAISNFYYRTKKLIYKVLILALSFIPMLIYFCLFSKNINAVLLPSTKEMLFFAVASIPILFMSYIVYFTSKKYFRAKIYMSLASFICINIVASGLLYFAITKRQRPIEIRQIFTNNTNTSSISSPYILKDTIQLTNLPAPAKNSTEYITVSRSLKNYLDRSVGTLRISSPVKVEALQVFISNENGIAIYGSDRSFISGDAVKFLRPQNPTMPFEINFSSEKNAQLKVCVKIFSYENVFDTKIKTTSKVDPKKYIQNFLMEAQYIFTLNAE